VTKDDDLTAAYLCGYYRGKDEGPPPPAAPPAPAAASEKLHSAVPFLNEVAARAAAASEADVLERAAEILRRNAESYVGGPLRRRLIECAVEIDALRALAGGGA
jgi:hypothetical protein